ncbi:glycoside hydrolase family 2 [bacterium]|nr:glycoside hydrolase family 2 [bacterium]
MVNVQARKCVSLNGKWQVIIDPMGIGDYREVWKERKPEKKTDFFEYAFEGGPGLDVPGDFNSQMTELTYYEGIVWYKKTFSCSIIKGKRLFLHFGAVNYLADVYLNTKQIGSHEGGFTPFQFEITNAVQEGENTVIVKVNNQRLKDGIPGLGFDWFNYGGITRDVNLVETNDSFIEDYFIQLKKNSFNEVSGWIRINGDHPSQKITVSLPELGIHYGTQSDHQGNAEVSFSAKFELWSPEKPKLYQVLVACETDTIQDEIGFRSIEVKGSKVLLNGQPVFFKGINIHEEMPARAARAFSEADAKVLLAGAKELGCNFVRLVHYPHHESAVRLAERMGLMVWDEIPVYQHIDFASPSVPGKISAMMREMISRDKNRCGVVIWSLSNETFHFTKNRTETLIEVVRQCRRLDPTRLVVNVFSTQGYQNNTITIWDTLNCYSDIICINEYIGWYVPWQGDPKETKWEVVCENKPLMITEFGGEALCGNDTEPKDAASSWSEEYQEQIYKKQLKMFKKTPNLVGTCPWLLADYRSMARLHPVFQKGWNRKGLLSDKGEKKKAWFVIYNFYFNAIDQ